MPVEQDLRELLIGFPGLAALVGSKVFAMKAPQGTGRPYITFKRISTSKTPAMVRNRPESKARFQFNCVAGTFDSVRAVVTQLNNALDRCDSSGSIITCFHAGEFDDDDEDLDIYFTAVDMWVHYTE